ncbi:phospholipase D family protein [Priestia megaterium]|uniref:phospholipase D family protein n=1 Tax=Priestia megaterium TaxID=1404 RepID=UPI00203C831D|nr:phospholipase D family protein [Priestia megaterium]MCM3541754.1 phospholipase D family protein [Priestia megaterium]
MRTYFWKQRSFWNDVNKEIVGRKPKKIIISSAYLSLRGVEYLKNIVETCNLQKKDIIVYCSADFHDTTPADILRALHSFATVHLMLHPFLHSKIYEFYYEDKVIFYHGSANLTDGGISQNLEFTSKETLEKSPAYDFWEHLSENSITVTTRVITLYQSYQGTLPPRLQAKDSTLQSQLEKLKREQQKIKTQPNLTGFYFDLDDYITVSKQWSTVANIEATKRRKAIRDKLLVLNRDIEPKVREWDLYPHYHKDYISSGITPSEFNHGRVKAIWIRYGKHKSELNPYGGVARKYKKGNKDPIEQFHKHACFQLSFSSKGIDLGMFHSTAHNGIDRYFVREHWNKVKGEILTNYQHILGYRFIWHFYDAKNDVSKYRFEIDKGTPEEFLNFYLEHDEDGLESFCMRHFHLDDERIRTKERILTEALKTYKVLIPIYQAMTYRIPASMR